jgi:hypothetical protein
VKLPVGRIILTYNIHEQLSPVPGDLKIKFLAKSGVIYD